MKEIVNLKDLSYNIGELFKTIRKKEKKTQLKVAQISGLSDGYISQIEKGTREKMIGVETADRIANAIFLPHFSSEKDIYIQFLNGVIEGNLMDEVCFSFIRMLSGKYKETPLIRDELDMYTTERGFEQKILFDCGEDCGLYDHFFDQSIAMWVFSFLGASEDSQSNLKAKLKRVEDCTLNNVKTAPDNFNIYEPSYIYCGEFDVPSCYRDVSLYFCKDSFYLIEKLEEENELKKAISEQVVFLNSNIYRSNTSTSFLLSSNIGENPVIKRMIDIFQDVPMTDIEQMLLNNTLDNIEEMRKQ